MKTSTHLVLITVLLLITTTAHAQNLIAVQNSNTPSFYTSLDTAIVHAANGDTIYIPGGNFALNTNISKRLHIIGVGYHPDSTLVTNPTNIMNSLFLITGASGGSLMGVKLNGDLQFGTTSENGNITNYTLARCYVGCVYSLSNLSTKNLFYENVLTSSGNGRYMSVNMSSAESNYFYNNIITGGYGGMDAFTVYGIGNGSIFKNNIFINNASRGDLVSANYSVFENNIFSSSGLFHPNYPVSNNIFNNNLIATSNGYYFGSNWNNTGINNIFEQPETSIFVNKTSNSFDYTQDYHLQPTCPGKNAGKDGTDVGIYGGLYPWKAGSIPSNPHIQTMKIAPQTDANGNLNVNIKVKAQDN